MSRGTLRARNVAKENLLAKNGEGVGVATEQIGPYQIEAVLGQGGMGEVFLARDTKLQRQVAIKRIRSDLPITPQQKARFRREALAVARLSHPSIVQIFELLETTEGDCLVMECVVGRSLAEHIAAGKLDLSAVLRLGTEIAEGLAEAHSKGLVHRDLKPENVLVTDAGHAKIVDFGLARMLFSENGTAKRRSETGLTQVGMLVGTLHAMSPEQAGGREIDHRSDLFSFGGLLYEMLTGHAPFRGENWLDTLRRVNAESPPPLEQLRSEVPRELAALVERLLSKEKERRPANARLVAAELEKIRMTAGVGEALVLWPVQEAPAAEHDLSAWADLPTGDWPVRGRSAASSETALRTLLRVEQLDGQVSAANLDEEARVAAAIQYLRSLRDLVALHGGVEVEKGDALLALFERPADALACALAHQGSLAELSAGLEHPLTARTAIHLGEILLHRPSSRQVSRGARPLEVEGAAKEVVARLGNLATAGQILLTQAAFDLARRATGFAADEGRSPSGTAEEPALSWLAHGSYFVEGAAVAMTIFEVGRLGVSPLSPPADSPQAHRLLSPSEESLLGWRPAPGQEIPRRPHWTLVERVGEGGFGEVWLARHKAGEERAFKFCFEAERLRALKREVTLFRLLKEALGHRDDIARILDWQFEEAPFFVESEYTEGGNLVRWAAAQGGLGNVPLETRIGLAADLAEALAAAHSVGVLHKDVKPANVLIGRNLEGGPRALLTDFGIGLLTNPAQLESSGVTAMGFTGTLGSEESGQGTPGYLAPELVEGKAASVQADIFSFGVLLYQMVVGDLKHTLAPGWERDIGDALLAEDIAAFVDGQPERRPASAREVAERLRTIGQRRHARVAAAARQEAMARTQKRRRLLSLLAVFALVVLLVVAVMGLREYRARRLAEAAEERASARQEQAEELIGFMLGDLRRKLDGVGRLDVLDAVGSQAMTYFAAVPAAELSDEELARRLKALYQIGEVRWQQGQLPAAREAFAQAARQAEALLARNPGKDDFAFELAQSYFWLGNVDRSQGQPEDAIREFAAYLAISESRAAKDDGDRKWQMEIAYASSSLASVYQDLGDLSRAEKALGRSIAIKERLLLFEPNNREWRSSLATGRGWLGMLHRSRGRPRPALAEFEAELLLREALLAEDPRDTHAQVLLVRCLTNLGDILLDLGKVEPASEHLERALALVGKLVEQDGSNRAWQRDLAVAHRFVAEVLLIEGRLASGGRHLERAEALLQDLVSLDASNGDWQEQLAETRILQSESHIRGEHYRTALNKAAEALTLLPRILAESQAKTKLRVLVASGRLTLGRALSRLGRQQEAREAWEGAARELEPWMSQPGALRCRGRFIWSRILSVLGRQVEADEIQHELLAAGYARPGLALVGSGEKIKPVPFGTRKE